MMSNIEKLKNAWSNQDRIRIFGVGHFGAGYSKEKNYYFISKTWNTLSPAKE